jgi:TatD DNase family protein
MKNYPLIDSHAHVDFDRFDTDRDAVMARAQDLGVKHLIQIAMGPEVENFERGYAIVETYPHCFMAAGMHPHDADAFTPEVSDIIRTYLQKPKVVALGEIGLDYYYDHSDRQAQRDCFATLMDVAIEENKPICVHTRDAFEDTVALTQASQIFQKSGGVIHCFTGNKDQARAFIDQGAYISFSGVVTFPKAVEVQEAAKFVPLDRMLVETDCPFLAPVPHRGKRNEPAYVVETAKTIAALKGISLEEVASATFQNTQDAFNLPL